MDIFQTPLDEHRHVTNVPHYDELHIDLPIQWKMSCHITNTRALDDRFDSCVNDSSQHLLQDVVHHNVSILPQ